MSDNDDTTKLIIYGLGITAALAFLYLIFKDKQPQQPLSLYQQPVQISQLNLIEQKLLQLENKIDKINQDYSNQVKEISTKTVSLKSDNPIYTLQDQRSSLKERFDML